MRQVLARVLLLGTIFLPAIARADIVFIPEEPPNFENLQHFLTLSLEASTGPLATSTIPSREPLTVTYTLGYTAEAFQDPDYTPELIEQEFLTWFEDSKTYLELWKGDPFTATATPIETWELPAATTGTVTLSFPEPGAYFIVAYLTNEVRDEAEYCTRYDVPVEDCQSGNYFLHFPHEETQSYFKIPLYEQETFPDSYPNLYAGTRLTALPEEPSGVSNVLFLPGIKGSRLYRATDNCDPSISLSCPSVKLWEPSGSALVRDLFLTQDGVSARNDIYVRESDILAEALGTHFYASFVNQMDALKGDGVFVDWRAAAYDWRLSLDDIATKGVQRGDQIYFNETNEVPYLEAALRELAASSATGKVSIVAHSNGGLVAKRLMQELESKGAAELVDKIIFVGVPQSGAPQAIAGLLYGYGEALPLDQCAENPFTGWLCSLLGSRAAARELAEHSPMAYHLLPSDRYFMHVRDSATPPVARFSAITEYFEERTKYGPTLDSADELYSFLKAEDGGRSKPATLDTSRANVLSTNLLGYGRTIHQNIDTWSPPANVQVYQIAGWGMPTIAGIEFYEQRKLLGGTKEMYRPIFVEDGDGVVPILSALMLEESVNIRSYWFNLQSSNAEHDSDKNHGTIFEIDELRIFIRDLLIGGSGTSKYVSESRPSQSSQDRLLFFLHSPLTLELYDSAGRHTGETEAGSFENSIPEAEYGVFGDVKYIIAPADTYTVKLNGKDTGTFSLDVQRISNGERSSQITFAEIPTTADTAATLTIEPNLEQAGALKVDIDGNGQLDIELLPELNVPVHYSQAPAATNTDNRKSKASSTVKSDLQALVPTTSEIVSLISPLLTAAPTTSNIFAEQETGSVIQERHKEVQVPQTVYSSQENQNLTASVYDSVGVDVLHWLGAVLYNLWTGFVAFLSSLS